MGHGVEQIVSVGFDFPQSPGSQPYSAAPSDGFRQSIASGGFELLAAQVGYLESSVYFGVVLPERVAALAKPAARASFHDQQQKGSDDCRQVSGGDVLAVWHVSVHFLFYHG